MPANTNDFIVEGDCPTGQSIIGAWAYWATDNSPLQVSVGYINDTTMAAVAYSTGIGTTQNATIQFSCATIPQPSVAKRQMLPACAEDTARTPRKPLTGSMLVGGLVVSGVRCRVCRCPAPGVWWS